MKTILVQGINANVGTSTIAAAITYQLSELNKTTILLDANSKQQANSVCTLFGVNATENTKGWYSNLKDKDENPFYNCFYKYENNSYCIPFGIKDEAVINPCEKVKDALSYLEKQNVFDYLIIDGGVRHSALNNLLIPHADVIFTIVEAEGNSLQRLNSSNVLNNEFFIINKLNSYCEPTLQIQNLLLNSKFRPSFLKTAIPFDESVISSYMSQMPFNRYLKISSASLELEKIVMEMFIMCKDTPVAEDQI